MQEGKKPTSSDLPVDLPVSLQKGEDCREDIRIFLAPIFLALALPRAPIIYDISCQWLRSAIPKLHIYSHQRAWQHTDGYHHEHRWLTDGEQVENVWHRAREMGPGVRHPSLDFVKAKL
ncbi:hypothetical protein B0H11DRAFT_2218439 [Mycena galericulata]|nr:hypothetical protein B0H11DRAFT_2218439 [Mycena galericulata]